MLPSAYISCSCWIAGLTSFSLDGTEVFFSFSNQRYLADSHPDSRTVAQCTPSLVDLRTIFADDVSVNGKTESTPTICLALGLLD
jgi:hypothetical protein